MSSYVRYKGTFIDFFLKKRRRDCNCQWDDWESTWVEEVDTFLW